MAYRLFFIRLVWTTGTLLDYDRFEGCHVSVGISTALQIELYRFFCGWFTTDRKRPFQHFLRFEYSVGQVVSHNHLTRGLGFYRDVRNFESYG